MTPTEPTVPWPSQLSAEAVAVAQALRRELQCCEGEHYVVERRPAEQGRSVLLRVRDAHAERVLPQACSARSRVHEYGGGSYLVSTQGVFFVEEHDQQIYRSQGDGLTTRLTNETNSRFGDLCEHRASGRLFCVRERHLSDAVVNDLVSVDLLTGDVRVLASGDDFYAAPSVDPDGCHLAFVSWSHPHMPWHSSRLYRAELNPEGAVCSALEQLGDECSSKSQPRWGRDGGLYFLDDRSGWWNIWRQSAPGQAIKALAPLEADLGRAQWELGARSFALADDGVWAIASRRGLDQLMHLETGARVWRPIPSEHTQLSQLNAHAAGVSCLATGPAQALGVWQLNSEGAKTVLPAAELPLPPQQISRGQSIDFDTRDGQSAQGFFYPPRNADVAVSGAAPPLIVVMHGGPTTACGSGFNPLPQYWTQRGLAVFDINYRGSTGFGRDYRLALAGRWGVADVEDCEDAVRELVRRALVDPARVAIRGGSAGGFTALAAAVQSDVFAVVGCHYGIGDLTLLAGDTHKFESRYLDHLIGPLPECEQRYRERSPIHRLERIQCPVFISHGRQDQVVPVNQALGMGQALRERGLEVETLLFDNERHGYTQEANIAQLMTRELAFFLRVFDRV